MQTPLHALLSKKGAQMARFAGWQLPLKFAGEPVLDSVRWTRSKASLFDVSHMLQTRFRQDALQRVIAADLSSMEVRQCKLALFLTAQGGIIDDAIVTRVERDSFSVVSNASRAGILREHLLKSQICFEEPPDTFMIALQGPMSAEVLHEVLHSVSDIRGLKPMHSIVSKAGWIISRTGYTGEDGVEVVGASSMAETLVTSLLDHPAVHPAGLAARDILRIEAGFLLSGQDMDESTVPGEVGLTWTLPRTNGKQPTTKDKILFGYKSMRSGPIPRTGMPLIGAGRNVGVVTSGCYSPTLEANICLAHVKQKLDQVQVEIRGQCHDYERVKLPFIRKEKIKV